MSGEQRHDRKDIGYFETYSTHAEQDIIDAQGKLIKEQQREILLLKAKIFKLNAALYLQPYQKKESYGSIHSN